MHIAATTVIVLVGNKSDLENERHVPTSEAREYADRSAAPESACHTTLVLACHTDMRTAAGQQSSKKPLQQADGE